MKRTNSLPLSLVVLTRPYCRENRYLQVLRSTVALNSYLGFSALCKIFFCFMYKIWQGRQLFHQTFWTQSEYLFESLSFAAFTKPNKHKTDSKDSSTTWPNFFSNAFTTVGVFKFFLKSLFATWWNRFTGTSDFNQHALKLPSLSHTRFLTRQIFTKSFIDCQF